MCRYQMTGSNSSREPPQVVDTGVPDYRNGRLRVAQSFTAPVVVRQTRQALALAASVGKLSSSARQPRPIPGSFRAPLRRDYREAASWAPDYSGVSPDLLAMSKCFTAKVAPLRPNPVTTSSAIHKTSGLVANRADPSEVRRGREVSASCRPTIGSAMKHATGTRLVNAALRQLSNNADCRRLIRDENQLRAPWRSTAPLQRLTSQGNCIHFDV